MGAALQSARAWGAVLLISVLCAGCAIKRQASHPFLDFSAAIPEPGIEIPFEFGGNYIFVPVTVAGTGPWSFVFDTGSQMDIIHLKHMAAMGLEPITNATLTINQSRGHVLCRGVPLDIASVHYQPSLIGATAFLDRLAQLVGRPIDGILGAGLLLNAEVTIDFENRLLRIAKPDPARPAPPGPGIPAHVEDTLWHVPASILTGSGQRLETPLLLDTGANGSLAIPASLPAETGAVLPGPFVTNEVIIIDQRLPSATTRAEAVEIGGFLLDGPLVTLDHGPFRPHAGTELLRRFTLTFRHPRLHLYPNSHFNEPFTFDMSGLGISAQGENFHQFLVELVRPASPAAEAGIAEGDWILSIDRLPADHWTLSELRDHLQQPGHHCRLHLRRNEETFRRTLLLRPLI